MSVARGEDPVVLATLGDQERGNSGWVSIERSGRVEDSDSKQIIAESQRVQVGVGEREGEKTRRRNEFKRSFVYGHVGNS